MLGKVGLTDEDWELAEKCGRANMVVDSARLTLDFSKPETYCPFSQLPYPDDEHFFPLCGKL